jgi:hypothetical protein
MDERRKSQRFALKVIHRHRVGTRTFRRVSELVFIAGRPMAVLDWINNGGMRTPIYICDLDPAKLRRWPAGSKRHHRYYFYDDVTVDPRFADMMPLPAVGHERRSRS